ncbi:isopenicillin N synthase family dioxygenase [Pseudooceanicola spongiae]|uniref:2-oxoglutarate-dependent ethylene/succinate-forming enzyme n=1 Tax=Pseudooceanicola spongiae TaxID=2613965 RepID=A0A7L9WP39_9RHOB|nr:isopenicillin N synthase family oxygenase [Pseudooceanicola spongiae]QOL81278.1 isopenicillin N synthase family oxygenase [Pseudooceanicola spongiae]
MNDTTYGLQELNAEKAFGGMGETVERDIPQIDMSDYFNRKDEIGEALWAAATEIGFFQLYNHGIPQELVDEAFWMSEQFFQLPEDSKKQFPLKPGSNAGWEFMEQVRPSTGTADRKESYQITLPRMTGLWPNGVEVPAFKATMMAFERHNWSVAMRVLSCFADRLGFTTDFFTEGHDSDAKEYQSTLRLIHYLGMENAKPEDFKFWRAGAHTDFDCLTLLHQKPGQGGLQLSPGKDAKGRAIAWTDVPPLPGVITCNIGDMLMRWSDDKLQSTLHRVRMPRPEEYLGPRYSMAYFAQANMDTVLQGPEGKYEPMTGHDYIQMRLGANFAKK